MKKLYILPVVFLIALSTSTAQMYPDRHNTNWFDGWVSCTSSVSPNTSRGDIHWVMYDLGYEYPLDEIKMWNCNIPDSTDMGLQNVIIDFSNDGVDWEELGNYTLTESDGSSIYQGESVGTMDGQSARYVLINALSNYGGSCYSFSELKIEVAEIAVPIQLISFDASCKDNNQVLLEWSTTNEINNDHFEIQKSADAQEWNTTGRVDAAINNTETNSYQFIDKSEDSKIQYYRLLQYDLDGRKTTYSIASVNCDNFLSEVALYPNPAEDKITVMISTGESSVLRVRLLNALGEEMRDLQLQTNVESGIILEDLPSGQYYLWIYNGDTITKEKFVKI